MVGVPGFEPGASWTRTMRDTKLRHTPMASLLYHGRAKSQVRIFGGQHRGVFGGRHRAGCLENRRHPEQKTRDDSTSLAFFEEKTQNTVALNYNSHLQSASNHVIISNSLFLPRGREGISSAIFVERIAAQFQVLRISAEALTGGNPR